MVLGRLWAEGEPLRKVVFLSFPSLATLRGRIGAYRLHATHDPRETTAAARTAFLAKFEAEVDPERVLPSEERARRAESARKAHFARLSYQSAKSRKSKSTKRNRKGDRGADRGDRGAVPPEDPTYG